MQRKASVGLGMATAAVTIVVMLGGAGCSDGGREQPFGGGTGGAAAAGSGGSTGGASGAGGTGGTGGQPPLAAVTYRRHVAPVLARRCQSCHRAGGAAPFALTTFAEARAFAPMLAEATAARRMPPWGAEETPECRPRLPMRGDLRLTDAEIALFASWRDAGAPEGEGPEPSPAPAPVAGLAGFSQEVKPRVPFITAGTKDQFRCFVMDPKLPTAVFLNGTHVVPGTPAVVHHAVVIADPTRAAARLADADGSWDCFGGVTQGIPDARLLQVWTPGADPAEYPPEIGVPVPANSLLVMQIHYHPAGAQGTADLTRFQMRFATSVPRYIMLPGLPIGNAPALLPSGDGLQPGTGDGPAGPEFLIPKGAIGHVEDMVFTWPEKNEKGEAMPPVYVFGVTPHMHYVGRDLRLTLSRRAPPAAGEPASECLVEVPRWDFNWQRGYVYDAPVESLPILRGGDRLSVHCSYDNSLANPFVSRALRDQGLSAPVDVRLGESTTDEMCLGLVSLLVRWLP